MAGPRSSPSRPRRRSARGFTLLELLVVLAILALLAAFVAPRVFNYLSGAKSDVAGLQMQSIRTALDFYRLDTGRFPSESEGLKALVERPASTPAGWNGPYLQGATLPLDPWSRAYLYAPDDATDGYVLSTLGADGRVGGDGEDRDLTLRN